MKTILRGVITTMNTINEWAGRAVSWLTLVLVLLVCYNVVMRRFFDVADAWRGELEWHLFALIFLIGAGYAFKHDRHVRVDLFYAKYSKREKAGTDLIGALVFLIPWCILIIIYAWSYAQGSMAINETSPNPDGLSHRYLIKFAISVGIGLLLLQAISSVAQAVLTLTTKNEPAD